MRCHGNGREHRCTPLRRDAVAALRQWLDEVFAEPGKPVFPNQRGGALSHDGLADAVARHPAVARTACTSLREKRVTPPVLRHNAAMELLETGVDRSAIPLWLGHESVETTYIYLYADLALKEKAMARTTPGDMPPERCRPEDEAPAFLNAL